jgi:phospholipid transport system substrate-binding protein
MTKRFLSSAVLVLAFVILAGTGRSSAAQDPGTFIGNLGTQAIQVMGPSVPFEQRAARFGQLFAADFDIPRIAEFVMGPSARSATPEQRQQFMAVFAQAMAENYARKFGEYGGEPFRVTGVRPEGGETVVASQVIRRSGAPIAIDWHVSNEGGQYKITDVAIDGLSMRVQERNLFASLMAQSGNRFDIALMAFQRAGESPQYGSSRPR